MENKENLSKLSNDELFKMLKKYGINAGPITTTTRSVYEKKLLNFLSTAPAANAETDKVVQKSSEEPKRVEKVLDQVVTQSTHKNDSPSVNLNKVNTVPIVIPSRVAPEVTEPKQKEIFTQKITNTTKTIEKPVVVLERNIQQSVKPRSDDTQSVRQELRQPEQVVMRASYTSTSITQEKVMAARVDDFTSKREFKAPEQPATVTRASFNSMISSQEKISMPKKDLAADLKTSTNLHEFKLLKPTLVEAKYTGVSTPSNIRSRTTNIERPAANIVTPSVENKVAKTAGKFLMNILILQTII